GGCVQRGDAAAGAERPGAEARLGRLPPGGRRGAGVHHVFPAAPVGADADGRGLMARQPRRQRRRSNRATVRAWRRCRRAWGLYRGACQLWAETPEGRAALAAGLPPRLLAAGRHLGPLVAALL